MSFLGIQDTSNNRYFHYLTIEQNDVGLAIHKMHLDDEVVLEVDGVFAAENIIIKKILDAQTEDSYIPVNIIAGASNVGQKSRRGRGNILIVNPHAKLNLLYWPGKIQTSELIPIDKGICIYKSQSEIDAIGYYTSSAIVGKGYCFLRENWEKFACVAPLTNIDWSEMQEKQYKWSRETFGESTLESNLDHLRDELDEIVENPNDIEEWADVMLLYMNASSFVGFTMDDIYKAVQKKYEKNVKRKWGKPDERGVVKHVE